MTQDVWPTNCCAKAYVVSPKKLRSPGLYELDTVKDDSHRRLHKGVTIGNCRMNSLLFPEELVRHAWIFATGYLACI